MSEIPGFYRDPVTGKYYKDVPDVSHNPSLKKLKIQREVTEEFKIKPKVTNVAQFLAAREIKAIGGAQESKEFLKMKWHLKKEIKCVTLNTFRVNFNVTSVNYIFGSECAIYGLWTDDTNHSYIIGSTRFREHFDYNNSYFHKAFGFVIDMCEGLDDDFIVVYNNSYRNGLLVERVDEYDRMPILQYGQHFAGRTLEISKRQILCCCVSKSRSCYAFGCDNVVGFISDHNRETHLKINGRVHTVVFNDTGNLMASGVHTGNLYLHDLRTNEEIMKFELSKSCLIDSCMLNCNQIIVAGTEDVLCNLDIRKREVVSEFFTHKQVGIRKQPISVANNMVCALGSDNRIRIWNLSGGFPIHKMTPLDKLENKIRGWLCSFGNKTLFYYFEGAKKKAFEII